MSKMVRKAREITKGVKGYDYLTLNVEPTWKDEKFVGFNISLRATDKEFENFKSFKSVHTDINGLIDLLVELRGLHIDNYKVRIFAYYHGCDKLVDFYNHMIEELDCYSEFDMEYEWG